MMSLRNSLARQGSKALSYAPRRAFSLTSSRLDYSDTIKNLRINSDTKVLFQDKYSNFARFC
ncbi:hypothetical protein POJ06DRAFT_245032 [Lipomyces tetrasporus]|uniref:Uncharacterized protein n=1 Tax=Lipomyces tetrasporus TaxID=54092 RepID=A0AAD7VV44_9ASCO|nr:uncharacterized protein POJ06DRAFT_245032 [Lipomyces tetrasporus]KAJ8102564.1 hypothetical protein POJ06DRAFT_245032 [Lipomyces tetrasporus]